MFYRTGLPSQTPSREMFVRAQSIAHFAPLYSPKGGHSLGLERLFLPEAS
jgi:hypothetical protein